MGLQELKGIRTGDLGTEPGVAASSDGSKRLDDALNVYTEHNQ